VRVENHGPIQLRLSGCGPNPRSARYSIKSEAPIFTSAALMRRIKE